MSGAKVSSAAAESSDDYPKVVARLNSRWRVVECGHGLQWILQYRGSAETYPTARWRGRSYCRTREALLGCSREHAGDIEPAALAILNALPERIDDISHQPDAPLTQETAA